MRITLFISILGLLHACNKSSGIYTRLFEITESEKFAVVNIDSFNTLSELETYICVENGKPIFPFDFEKKKFNKTVKTGIELLFNMSYCGHHVHFSSQVTFEMDSLENWNYEGKLLRKERLLELVKMNFLNRPPFTTSSY